MHGTWTVTIYGYQRTKRHDICAGNGRVTVKSVLKNISKIAQVRCINIDYEDYVLGSIMWISLSKSMTEMTRQGVADHVSDPVNNAWWPTEKWDSRETSQVTGLFEAGSYLYRHLPSLVAYHCYHGTSKWREIIQNWTAVISENK